MPKAKNTSTTPKRRTARGFSAAETAAGLDIPAIASTQPDDADLIRLCVEIVAIKPRMEAVHVELDALYERQAELIEMIGGGPFPRQRPVPARSRVPRLRSRCRTIEGNPTPRAATVSASASTSFGS
jgi:hypothetical protein